MPALRNRWQPTFSLKVNSAAMAMAGPEQQAELARQLLHRCDVAGVRIDHRRAVVEVLAPSASELVRGAVVAVLQSLGLVASR